MDACRDLVLVGPQNESQPHAAAEKRNGQQDPRTAFRKSSLQGEKPVG
jgi:hypothetical protein